MISELGYNVVKKNAASIAQFLYMKLIASKKKGVAFGPLQNGTYVNLLESGLSLDFKLRKEFAAACLLLHKKNKVVFLLSKYEVLVFHSKMSELKKSMKQSPSMGFKKIAGWDVHSLFGHFGIKKGGKAAFYNFLIKLGKFNSLHEKKFAVGAVIYKGKVPVTHITYGMFGVEGKTEVKEEDDSKATDYEEEKKEEEEEKEPIKIETHIEIPDVKIKLDKLLLVTKNKSALMPLKIDGASSSSLKASVAKNIVKDKEVLKLFDGNKDKAEAFAHTSIKGWADSSTKTMESSFLQAAVANLTKMNPKEISPYIKKAGKFKYKGGLFIPKYKGTYTFYKYSSSYAAHKEIEKYGEDDPVKNLKMHMVLAHTIYKRTQEFLKKKGKTELVLFRGMRSGINLETIKPKKVTLKLNPLSSFSTSYSEAEGFGNHVMVVSVPASRIFSCAATGYGCWGEQEFTVIGGKIKSWAINTQKLAKALDKKGYYASNQIDNKIQNYLKKLVLGEKTSIKESVMSNVEEGQEVKIYADEGDNADWVKETLDGLPLIGTQEFQAYVASSGKTIEQVLASTPYRIAHIKFAPVVIWLRRMANTIDGEKAVVKVKPIDQIKSSLCHLATARGIATRMNVTDKIWFFGDNDGKHPHVFHSLLTTRRNKVVANNYRGVGNLPKLFDPIKGYKTPAGEYLPVLDKLTVKEFLTRFFR